MKKHITLNIVFFLYYSITFAQTKPVSDTTISLPTDIYSNYSKEYYSRTNSNTFMISKEHKDRDSIKILSVGYDEIINMADKFYKKKDFANAAYYYITAFKINNDLGKVEDRLKTACCFSMLNNYDSSFLQLFRIAFKGNYINLTEINSIEYLKPLYKDKRWLEVINLITKNRNKLIEKLNSELPVNGTENEINQ